MEFQTICNGKKRQMILFPQANAKTFLLFFEKGNSGCSWSLRDYSVAHQVVERYAYEFGCSAMEVRQKALHAFDAPTVSTTDLNFWHDYTTRGDALFLKKSLVPDVVVKPNVIRNVLPPRQGQFPILNLDGLRTLPKAGKRQDFERMLSSPNSEDWVTWNLFNLFVSQNPNDWHLRFVAAAKNANPAFECSMGPTDAPHLEFWRRVSSPSAYQAASREKMRQSRNPSIVARSFDPRPVEGESEIDVVISTGRHLLFVEAKLGSDVAMHTTYDGARNQIVRNIDCVLETACDREPFFWMVVRDAGPGRLYSQLIKQYREDPEVVIRELPHRDPRVVRRICKSIAIIRWEDLAGHALEPLHGDPEDVRAVKSELRKRVVLAA